MVDDRPEVTAAAPDGRATVTGQPTVVIAVHDGVYGAGTGAGYANRGFLQTLTSLVAPGVRLVVMPVYLASDSPEYQAGWHRQSIDICRAAGAIIRPVDNGTGGQVRFGGVPEFARLATTTATALRQEVLPGADPVAVVLFDVPFLGVPPLLPAGTVPRVAAVIRSTGLLHDPSNQDRIHFEREGLRFLANNHGRVAAISGYMREHLGRDYQVPAGALIDLPDGLTPAEWQLSQLGSSGSSGSSGRSALPPPARAGFLYALGRAQPYKGWDDLLDALAQLGREGAPVPHALLAAVTDQPTTTPYQHHLATRIRTLGLDATLLTRFDAANRGLLAHPALRAVVIPSRSEPFGRVPLEAYAAGAAPVVVTTAGGLPEQVVDGVTGFTAAPADPASLARAIDRALRLRDADRARMRAAGRELARTRFDHADAIRRFFARFAPWACHVPAARTAGKGF